MPLLIFLCFFCISIFLTAVFKTVVILVESISHLRLAYPSKPYHPLELRTYWIQRVPTILFGNLYEMWITFLLYILAASTYTFWYALTNPKLIIVFNDWVVVFLTDLMGA